MFLTLGTSASQYSPVTNPAERAFLQCGTPNPPVVHTVNTNVLGTGNFSLPNKTVHNSPLLSEKSPVNEFNLAPGKSFQSGFTPLENHQSEIINHQFI